MADPEGVWSPARRRLTIGLTLTISLVASETLAIATVMPTVSGELDGIGLYGWVFSAFFLGTMVGIVVAGQSADRLGAAPAFTLGLLLFAGGLLVGGLAQNMEMLVAARAVQGFGAGAVPAIGYVCIGRSYPSSLQPRMFAVLATAWVVPGILGPGAAGVIEHAFGWRWVFLALVPLVALSGAFTLPAMRPIGPGLAPDEHAEPSLLPAALLVAAGSTAVLAGLGNDNLLVAAGLIVAGAVIAGPAYLRLVPPGTVRARAGMPAAILARGSLTFAFFGVDAYIPLALADVRGLSTLWIGASLTFTTLAWTVGAWTQERLVERTGPRRMVAIGHAVIVVSIAVTAVALIDEVPVAVAFIGWTLGGLGIGLAYPSISLTVLTLSDPGREGAATSSLQVTEQLGISIGIGMGGAAVAAGAARDWDPAVGIAVAWGISAVVAVAGLVIARRLPRSLPARMPVATP